MILYGVAQLAPSLNDFFARHLADHVSLYTVHCPLGSWRSHSVGGPVLKASQRVLYVLQQPPRILKIP